MRKNENIICISSIDWDFVWQSHQEIMSTFAKNGNRVLFIENTGVRKPGFRDIMRLKKRVVSWLKSIKGFRKESGNLFIYSPVVLPFPYSRFACWINKRLLIEPLKRWIKAMSFHDPIIWTFLPTTIALEIIDELSDRKLLVYDCVADFEELTDNPKMLKKTEEILIKKSDIIFAQGKVLADKCRKLNANVHIFPPGVNTKIFEDYLSAPVKGEAEGLKEIKKPIIGYVGGIHKHVDMTLIHYMAASHPEWSIVLVGPKQTDTSQIDAMPNVFALGKKEFNTLPAYINGFDVCTIPYLVSGYTETVYPSKLNEYHIMGKPVVSTALPEVEAMNEQGSCLTAIARTREEFVKLVEKALACDHGKISGQRMELAKKNSWNERIERMSALMESAIERKKKAPSANWQEKFLLLYKNTRRGALKALSAGLALYLLLFYTPLMWFLAGPLAIADQPQKADAIVVLGGGVGESGKAGQGYEERVQYAVELYKKGYAGHIVFSSGYTYVFKETLVMKALAVALGVSAKDIILDDKSANTYQNVEQTREIMLANKWRSALLVSSPYHMKRLSLVFEKYAGDMKIAYTPVPRSAFYAHEDIPFFHRQISFGQIKGIVHEYIGIAYYWWKGWI
ncbi:MAG: YdcF family protein [Candidatus Omnitrophica bacterium]|nr:YdcF family protein [Candidatus Omnitrophota bacterium]